MSYFQFIYDSSLNDNLLFYILKVLLLDIHS